MQNNLRRICRNDQDRQDVSLVKGVFRHMYTHVVTANCTLKVPFSLNVSCA